MVTKIPKIKRPIIVAELSINHLGMRKIAIAILEKCKEIGVDYIKLKLKNVEKYYQKKQELYNGYDFILYRKSLELKSDDFNFINLWCKKNNLPWFSTIHDLDGLKTMSKLEVPFYKIASSDALNLDFVQKVINFSSKEKNKRKLIISCGGADISHIDKIVAMIPPKQTTYLLHCVSIYPTPVDKSNIAFIKVLKERYRQPNIHIGYSGHEEGWIPTLMAVELGAEIVERHITLSKDLKIHHIQASLDTNQFSHMVKDINYTIDIMKADFVTYFDEELDFLKDKKYI